MLTRAYAKVLTRAYAEVLTRAYAEVLTRAYANVLTRNAYAATPTRWAYGMTARCDARAVTPPRYSLRVDFARWCLNSDACGLNLRHADYAVSLTRSLTRRYLALALTR